MAGPERFPVPGDDWQGPLRYHRPKVGCKVWVSRWPVSTRMMHTAVEA